MKGLSMDNLDKCGKWNNRECPRCKKSFTGYPALSRVDNETEICSPCGVEEAIIQFKVNFLNEHLVEDKIRS